MDKKIADSTNTMTMNVEQINVRLEKSFEERMNDMTKVARDLQKIQNYIQQLRTSGANTPE